MAKIYTIKFVVDGKIVLVDKAFLTKEEVRTLESDGIIVKED